MEIQVDLSSIKAQHQLLISKLQDIKFFEKFSEFRKGLKKNGRYLSDVLRMLERLFLYVRSSRQILWHLQLVTLEDFTKYFYVFDLTNYSKMTTIYLSDMYKLREADPET